MQIDIQLEWLRIRIIDKKFTIYPNIIHTIGNGG